MDKTLSVIDRRQTIEAKDGHILVSKQHFQFPIKGLKWVGWWRTETEDFEISQLGYFRIYSGLLKKYVVFGTDEKSFVISLKAENAATLQEIVEAAKPFYMGPDTIFHEVKSYKHPFSGEQLWVNPTYVVYVQHKGFFATFEKEVVQITDVAFYNQSGIIFKELYFGYLDQIEIALPNKDFIDSFEKYLKNHGAKIGLETGTVYQSKFRMGKFYNPAYWFYKETIAFTDDALVYNFKSFATRDTMYLPYEQISLALPTKGWFTKRIIILGDMHIVTKNPFDKEVVDLIMDELHKHGVSSMAQGESFTPSGLWFEWFYNIFRSPVKAIVTSENLYVVPGRLGGLYRGVQFSADANKEEQKDFLKSAEKKRTDTFSLVRIKDICNSEFDKPHFWNLTGTLVLEFLSTSIRKDQNDIESNGIIVMCNIRKSEARRLVELLGREI